jgi:hypothetical protein
LTSDTNHLGGRWPFFSSRPPIYRTLGAQPEVAPHLTEENVQFVVVSLEEPDNPNPKRFVMALSEFNSLFVKADAVADITEPKSVPQELQLIVSHLPSVPVQPLPLASEHEYGMFGPLKSYPWVL